jgi:hypothetical protein
MPGIGTQPAGEAQWLLMKGTHMKLVTSAGVVAGVIASAAVGFAGVANAAPAGPQSVDRTKSELQSQGFHVIIDKIGTHPLDKCVVDSVRPGQAFERRDSGAPGATNDIVTTVTSKTVFLDVSC